MYTIAVFRSQRIVLQMRRHTVALPNMTSRRKIKPRNPSLIYAFGKPTSIARLIGYLPLQTIPAALRDYVTLSMFL